MADPAAILNYFRRQTTQMVSLLEELVKRESPSTDKTAVDRAADLLVTELSVLPVDVERLAQSGWGDFVRVRRRADGQSQGKAILLLTHMDTVWPVGELARRPFKVDGNRITGPGCLDNKCGQVFLLAVLRAIRDLDITLARPLTAILNSDEEIGSRASRGLIENETSNSDFVLCLEAARPNGALVTARKAAGGFTMNITGKASHAGVAPEQGVSAIHELALQIAELHALNEPDQGITVNVGVVNGGERGNVVAAQARALIDLRAPTVEAGDKTAQRILSAKPHHEGIRIDVTGGFGRPPMERTEQVAKLFKLAGKLADSLGLNLTEAATGGGSDASFAGALGVPTLDGLGPVGAGGHSEDEHVMVDSLAERAALLTLLVSHLANEGL